MRKYEVKINKKTYSVAVKSFTPETAVLQINGKSYVVKMDEPLQPPAMMSGGVVQYNNGPAVAPLTVAPPPMPAQSVPQADATPAPDGGENVESVTAPIPGSIMEICVKPGDTVTQGQTVLKMEAMKMENEINTSVNGTVKAILVVVGDAVNQGEVMMEITPA